MGYIGARFITCVGIPFFHLLKGDYKPVKKIYMGPKNSINSNYLEPKGTWRGSYGLQHTRNCFVVLLLSTFPLSPEL